MSAGAAAARGFESVIGLEVHVQLATASKLFCACPNRYGDPPNVNTCEVCTGQPGVLPVLNREALVLAARAGLALGCSVAPMMRFDRKNYFYPDLPKGYQISQFAEPVNRGGAVEIDGDDGARRPIGIVRAHLEEDAGKTLHPEGRDVSLLDLNRAGIALLEIVSAPDLRSPAEAFRYLTELKRILRYARVSECDMEKGSLRCDANVSVRRAGDRKLGTRTEIKNLNSFRNVERALEYEIARQVEVVAAGGAVVQETRGWRDAQERTEAQRSKEEAEDYRYFPDPDLPPFAIDEAFVAEVRASLPEGPHARRERYVERLVLAEAVADALTAERDVAEFFDGCVAAVEALDPEDAALVAQLVLGPVLHAANERTASVQALGLDPLHVVDVARRVRGGRLSRQAAKSVLAAVIETRASPEQAVKSLGLEQVSDVDVLEQAVAAAIDKQPQAVADFRAGNANALNALVGAVMKGSKGKANPNLVRELLAKRLAAGGDPGSGDP